ncbi:MAG TPA: endonuclease/exonuclease/phosphatase family protein, partial [Acidimicrobiales bacterium]
MSDARALRVMFWNAWLLHPRLWPNVPKIPGLEGVVAPNLPERANAIGQALPGRFDVMAFSETFEPDEREALVAGWAGRPNVTVANGPKRRAGFFTNSGLVTVVDGLPVTRQANAPYKTSGQWWRDSDGMAHKGVLLVEVDPGEGLPHVEVYSTHLFAGGGWIPAPGHADHLRHHDVRMAEADELVAFVERRHHAGNVVVVCGDMNVARDDVRLDGDQTARFRDLSERFARAGLVDAG